MRQVDPPEERALILQNNGALGAPAEEVADARADRAERHEPGLWRGAAWAAAIFVASRAVVLLSVGVAGVVREDWSMRRALGHWDGGWYLLIAELGYPRALPPAGSPPQTVLAFFPMFPLLIRMTSDITGLSSFRAALLLNLLLGTLSASLVWLLARHLGDRPFADRSTALYAFFPASFVLTMVYSEPLMLALSVFCLYALVRRWWLLAGTAAAIATATRPNAIALCVACAVGSALAIFHRREWRSVVAPLCSPLGLLAFSVYLALHTGDPLMWLKAQRSGWGQGFDGGWALVKATGRQLADPGSDLNEVTAGLSLVFVVVAFVLLARWKPPGVLTAYAAVVIALGYLSPTLSSRPRFALTAFPLILAVGAGISRSTPGVVGTSAVVLGAFCVISVSTLAITP